MSAKVFVSFCGENQNGQRSELVSVLAKAGLEVVNPENVAGIGIEQQIEKQLAAADCTILLLFSAYSPLAGSTSLSRFQFLKAKEHLERKPDHKLVVWMPSTINVTDIEPQQQDFVNEVRNNISANMIFANAASALQITDDLRSLMEKRQSEVFDVKSTDIFLISNELDESEANEIIDMLSDIVPVERLSIVQDSEMNYSEYCSQQIGKSKLAVVYFKESGEWAVPFAQQVWKKIGGASAHTPILLIGDEDPDTNMDKKLKAPKVISLIVAGELIPLEIKVQFDKVIEKK